MTNTKTLNKNVTLAQVQLQQVIEQLNHLSTDELVNTYNDYADQNSYDRINNLDEGTINELYSSPWQALYDSNHKDFNDRDYFFTYNGNGHMISFSNEDNNNCPIDIEELAQWIVDNDLFSEYNISVTTLDDILASIEDNINDDETMTYKLASYINESYDSDDVASDVAQWCIVTLYNYDYEQLNDIITMLGIDYE